MCSVVFVYSSDSMALNSQPQGIASGKDGLLVVASLKDVSGGFT